MPAGRPRTKPFGPKNRPKKRGPKAKVTVVDRPATTALNKLVKLTTSANGIEFLNKRKPSVVTLKRSLNEYIFTSAAGTAQFFAFQYALDDFVASAGTTNTALVPYVALYRKYKLTNIKVSFHVKTFGDATNNRCPSVYVYKCTDAITSNISYPAVAMILPSANNMLDVQKESVKVLRSSHEHRMIDINIKPFILYRAYTTAIGGTSYEYVSANKNWSDTTYTKIPHYGLNVYFTDLTAGDIIEYDMEYTFKFTDER